MLCQTNILMYRRMVQSSCRVTLAGFGRKLSCVTSRYYTSIELKRLKKTMKNRQVDRCRDGFNPDTVRIVNANAKFLGK
jgi:hypothetical protein